MNDNVELLIEDWASFRDAYVSDQAKAAEAKVAEWLEEFGPRDWYSEMTATASTGLVFRVPRHVVKKAWEDAK